MGVSRNLVLLQGYLGRDPEIRYTDAGTAVCTLSVASTERWTDDAGKEQESTEWHRVNVWRGQAEFAAKYLKKGSAVDVEGRLETRKWTDKDGIERWSTEITCRRLQGLDRSGARRDEPPPPSDEDAPRSRSRGSSEPPPDDGPPPEHDTERGGDGNAANAEEEERVLRLLGTGAQEVDGTAWPTATKTAAQRMRARGLVKFRVEGGKHLFRKAV